MYSNKHKRNKAHAPGNLNTTIAIFNVNIQHLKVQ